jgi:hypothetical protein
MMHSGEIIGDKWRIVPGGGNAYLGVNATGAPSVRGTILGVGPVDGAIVFPGSETHPGGVAFESDIPDGDPLWIITMGPAWVLLEDGAGANRGDWLRMSPTAGRACAATKPTFHGIPELYEHMRQVGYALSTVSSGTDVLCPTFLKLI